MSLGIVIKGPEGIVLAADSRVTLMAQQAQQVLPPIPGENPQPQVVLPVFFDNATKLLTFAKPNQWVAAVTYGDAVIGTNMGDLRTAQSFIPEFEVGLPKERLSVQKFSERLSEFFLQQWTAKMPPDLKTAGMTFVVGGFDQESPYGSTWLFIIPHSPTPQERSPAAFGVTFGGQNDATTRLLKGYDLRVLEIARRVFNAPSQRMDEFEKALGSLNLGIPYAVLPLQDCINLAIFLMKTTISAQNLTMGVRGVGGSIDVAVITRRKGVEIIQRKELVGEVGYDVGRKG